MQLNTFKKKPGFHYEYPINNDTYLRVTGKNPPYCQVTEGKESLFAVCPMCDNPIQIVGLYKRTPEGGRRPYGKHHLGSIPKLAPYREAAYLNCPYANAKRKPVPIRNKVPIEDSSVQNVLRFMRNQYDHIINTLSEDLDIRISYTLARRLAVEYICNQGWNYLDARGEQNLPWILGQVGQAPNLYGQYVKTGTALYDAIAQKCPEVKFEENVGLGYAQIRANNNQFVYLTFCLLNPRFIRTNGQMIQTIDLLVNRDVQEEEEVFRKTIRIDTNKFYRNCQLPHAETQRSQKLLEIAAEVIPVRGMD